MTAIQGDFGAVLIAGGASNAAVRFRRRAAADGMRCVVLSRRPLETWPGETFVLVDRYADPPAEAVRGCRTAVNFVGAAKGGRDELFAVNVEGLEKFARICRDHGVRRFLHIGSLSVYGGQSILGRQTAERPSGAYGESKLAGDRALLDLASSQFEVLSLRVPKLYGPGAPSTLALLARVMLRLRWFPAPNPDIRRSVLHYDNLAAALARLIAGDQTGVAFAADPEPFTFAALAAAIAKACDRPIRLVPMPATISRALGFLVPAVSQRLLQSSEIENDSLLGWSEAWPPAVESGLEDLVRGL